MSSINNMDNSKRIYSVEKILRKKIIGGRSFYLIKWQRWSTRHNSWEPEENILDRRLLEAYEEEEQQKKGKKLNITPKRPTSKSNQSRRGIPSISGVKRTPADTSTSSSVYDTTTSSSSSTSSSTSTSLSANSTTTSTPKTNNTRYKSHNSNSNTMMAIFNPVVAQPTEEVFVPKSITKEPILITDVTANSQTVTIRECRRQEGFFSSTRHTGTPIKTYQNREP